VSSGLRSRLWGEGGDGGVGVYDDDGFMRRELYYTIQYCLGGRPGVNGKHFLFDRYEMKLLLRKMSRMKTILALNWVRSYA